MLAKQRQKINWREEQLNSGQSYPNEPGDPLDFIKQCVRDRRIFWTYHVNMRLKQRAITRSDVIQTVDGYEIIEFYPGDKYLPSYLVWVRHDEKILHVLFATDVENMNVRIVTAYQPDPDEWDADMKRRKQK
jgi:hypothetical protein